MWPVGGVWSFGSPPQLLRRDDLEVQDFDALRYLIQVGSQPPSSLRVRAIESHIVL